MKTKFFIKYLKVLRVSILVLLFNSIFSHISISQIITGFSPLNGNVGATVSISGNGFNITPSNNVVYFGASKANVLNANATSLTVAVPMGATYSPITVLNLTSGLSFTSSKYFNPTFSPNKGLIKNDDILAKADFLTGSSPLAISVGDLNNDGLSDLISANSSSGPNISVLRNISSSDNVNFASKVDFSTTAAPNSLAVHDLDGDGKLDIVTVAPLSNAISVLRNTSTGGNISFAPKVDLTGVSNCTSIAVGDLNSDGKPDLILANNTNSNNNISILKNTSTSGLISFENKIDLAFGFANPKTVRLGDLDGDNKLDLIVTKENQFGVSIMRNINITNTFAFAPKIEITTYSYALSSNLGDVNSDGKLDLVITNSWNTNGNMVSIFKNTSIIGGINFATWSNIPVGSPPSSISIGDLNGDEKPDLAMTNLSNNNISIFSNNSDTGNINFLPNFELASGLSPSDIAIADLNGDGKPDISVSNSSFSSSSLSIYKNAIKIPEIIISGIIPSFKTCFGKSSNSKSFYVRGKNLVSNIEIKASTGFEISLDSISGFDSIISLIPTSDSVANTKIFCKMNGTNIGAITGNISCKSNWALVQNKSVVGDIFSSTFSSQNLNICPNQLPFYWNGLKFDSTGSKTKFGLVNSNGCDSSATLNLFLLDNLSSFDSIKICSNQFPYYWNGIRFDSAGTKSKFGLQNVNGCDSSATLKINVNPISFSIDSISICSSQLPYYWNGLRFDSSGIKIKNGLINKNGCDSSASLNLILKPIVFSIDSISICPNQVPYFWNGLRFDSTGIKTKTGLIGINGCDSTASLKVIINKVPQTGLIVGPENNLSPLNSYNYAVNQQLNMIYNWQITNGIIVSGQGSNQITVQFINSGTSELKVILSNSKGCADTTSKVLNVISVGLIEQNSKHIFEIFPNPAGNQVNFLIDRKFINKEFKIIDQTGKLIFTGYFKSTNEVFDLDDIPNGIYSIVIDRQLSKRFVILKN